MLERILGKKQPESPKIADVEEPQGPPAGHFYSPVVDIRDAAGRRSEIWPPNPVVLGVDFNDASHLDVLTKHFPQYMDGYDYPENGPPDEALLHFYTQNSQFSWLDSRVLFVLLRALSPRNIIEVGSGYSSLLMADVNARFLSGAVNVTCIEPFPRAFLKSKPAGISRIVERRVQEVSLEEFDILGDNDILFIDSSHVSKTGSDVNFLFFDVLPRLAKGVRIHIHDIFLPNDYPENWVLQEARSWNEQYLLRALLMYSSMFRVTFGCSYAYFRFPDKVKAALNHPHGHAFSGGSFWIEKIG
ncbi:MAG: class I SAM-dependent methyltransferase [Betaproteobacteria bacterium]